ncbi:hypothetical protein H5410_034781 [Solanum commersonii]|uniref:Uncharacterized protein n=1 Tax=Solanum commersonii TaxID=4109 RepID=A0A9J5YRL7_SOLCO|nr:hypothetical protein H5410_034781 [Solanum commersonii]
MVLIVQGVLITFNAAVKNSSHITVNSKSHSLVTLWTSSVAEGNSPSNESIAKNSCMPFN